MFEEETLGRDRYGEECAPAQQLVFSEHTPNTTGRIGSWTWLPFRPCRGRGAGHGTPESEKTAFSETSFASSIITVMKEQTAVRGCLTPRQQHLEDRATGAPQRPKQQGRALYGKRRMDGSVASCTQGWCFAFPRFLLRSDSGSIPSSFVLGNWKYQAGA